MSLRKQLGKAIALDMAHHIAPDKVKDLKEKLESEGKTATLAYTQQNGWMVIDSIDTAQEKVVFQERRSLNEVVQPKSGQQRINEVNKINREARTSQ